jgi:predicted nucleic acid-binding protein
MGQLAVPASGVVYVDANAVIYRGERIEPYLTASAPLWDAVDAGRARIVTSELTLLEVLVKPMREGKTALVAFYRQLVLGTVGFTALPLTRPILEKAAELRAFHALKTPDAIHAATALSSSCVELVTNDAGFLHVPGLSVALLSQVVSS